jgi:hypothetical protein
MSTERKKERKKERKPLEIGIVGRSIAMLM